MNSIWRFLGSPGTCRHGQDGPGIIRPFCSSCFIYDYLNRIPSNGRLKPEAGRNVEVMWLTGGLVPDHKTIADFRRGNGAAIGRTCARFVELCRRIGTLKGARVAIDGSEFKADNNRDRNFTKRKIAGRRTHLEADVQRYIDEMVRFDRQENSEARATKVANLAKSYAVQWVTGFEKAAYRGGCPSLPELPRGTIRHGEECRHHRPTSAGNCG